jgi:hypothetical protein
VPYAPPVQRTPPPAAPQQAGPPGAGAGLAPWAVEAEAQEAAAQQKKRRKRVSPRARRGVEVLALLVLVPAGIGAHWYDDSHTLLPRLNPGERVTVVPHGGSGAVENVTYRMVGRESKTTPSTYNSGGVQILLDVDRRPADQAAVKAAKAQTFRVRDREGHVWDASLWESVPEDPTAGQTQHVQIQTTVPKNKVSEVVLDVLGNTYQAKSKKKPLPVLRLAH